MMSDAERRTMSERGRPLVAECFTRPKIAEQMKSVYKWVLDRGQAGIFLTRLEGACMSVILGINMHHADSAACVLVDGKLRSAVAEERLGERMKHSPAFPINAILCVLREAGARLKDVTHLAVARNPQANYGAKMSYVLHRPVRSAGAVFEHLRRRRSSGNIRQRLATACDEDPRDAHFRVVNVEHHLAHIASAYYLSSFEALTAGWSYDASGDFVSAMAARCEGTKIEPIHRVFLPHSLGFFYTAICQFIGFDQFGEEYKVMGLSSYGRDNYRELMQRLVRLDDDEWFALEPDYFGTHEGGESGATDQNGNLVMGRLYTDILAGHIGPSRRRGDPVSDREKDLAKSCQVRFEEAALHCLEKLHRLVPTERLAMAGGCALNGVANARIHRETPFQKAFVQPASSDDGTCLGAAYYAYHNVLGGTERFHMEHAYWGPEYSESDLRLTAENARGPCRRLEDAELLDVVARYLHAGKVVGWYQGRSEWGPRALGNRSILVDPSRPDAKELLNEKIKRRESFRPFAPTVLREHVAEIFDQDIRSPFMMHVVKIRPQWQSKLPAVTHVDGTGRLQSLERRQNPRYYDLIKAFASYSGVPVLLNTSFNENEPIVDTPQQALDCFLRTDMDVLVLGNYVVAKARPATEEAAVLDS